MKYPAMILTEDGWGVVFEGHGLTPEALEAACVDWFGGTEYRVEEVHFEYVPRIKNCSERDGWGCDNEGDWHAHWFGVRPAADGSTAFTVIHEAEVAEPVFSPGQTAAEVTE